MRLTHKGFVDSGSPIGAQHANTPGVWKPDDEAEYFSSSLKCWLRAVVAKVRSSGDIKLKVFAFPNSKESRDVTVDERELAMKIRTRQTFDPLPHAPVRRRAF